MPTDDPPRQTPRNQVVVVRYGTRTTRRSEVFLNYGSYGEPDRAIDMDYFLWVIRGDTTVVVDTGFASGPGGARGRRMLVHPLLALRELGIEPADVGTVVLTHAHYDHVGNLGAFRSARIVISRAEYDFWASPQRRRHLFHMLVEDDELQALRDAHDAGRVETFGESTTLGDGIDVVRVGGHTPGQSMVLVSTTEGTVLLTSDAVHYEEELERDMPFAHVADLPATYAGFDRVRVLRERGIVEHIVTGHDPDTLSRLRPVPGALRGLAATIG